MKTLFKIILSLFAAGFLFTACEKNEEFLLNSGKKGGLNDSLNTNNLIVGSWINVKNDNKYANGYFFSDSTFILMQNEGGTYSEKGGTYTIETDSLYLSFLPQEENPYQWIYGNEFRGDTLVLFKENIIKPDSTSRYEELFVKTDAESIIDKIKGYKQEPKLNIEGTWLNAKNNDSYSNGYIFNDGYFQFIENEAGNYMERDGQFELLTDSVIMHVNPSTTEGKVYDWHHNLSLSQEGDTLFISNEAYIKCDVANPLKVITPEKPQEPSISTQEIMGTWLNIQNNKTYSNGYIFNNGYFKYIENEAGYYMERDGEFELLTDSVIMHVNPSTTGGNIYDWHHNLSLSQEGDTLYISNEAYIKSDVENPFKDFTAEKPQEPSNSSQGIIGTWLNIQNNKSYSDGYIFKEGYFKYIENEVGNYMERDGEYELSTDSILMHVNSTSGGEGYDWFYNLSLSKGSDTLYIYNDAFIKSDIENPLK